MKKNIISVAVISYNSEATILETLNSILHQDYGSQYIELILGDDGSKDNTQNIINEWVIIHKNNFHKVILNISNINRGIVTNFNSTCQLATSDWIKPIAADDILIKDCISEFKKYIDNNKNTSVNCVFCKVQMFNKNNLFGIFPDDDYYFKQSPLKQFKTLLISNYVPAPGCFMRTSLLTKCNLPDERLSLEDYPLWLKFASSGIKLELIDKVLVYYRINESISHSNQRLINLKLNNDVHDCKKKYLSKLDCNIILKSPYYLDILLSRLSDLIGIHIFRNKRNKFTKAIVIRLRILSPIYFITKLKYRMKKHHRSN